MEATDTPLSDEQAADMLMEPIETEDDTEADEAPQIETETDDVETEDDASEVEDEKDDEADDEDEASDEDDDSEDEADDEDEDDSDQEQPANSYTVKVDGEERTVTLDELQRGYSGQAYIQKGMEANKTQERVLSEHAQTLQQQAQVVQQLYQQSQQTGFTPAPQEPDPALLAADPIAYFEAEGAYRTQMRAYQTEQQQIQFLQQQTEAQKAAQTRDHMQAQEARLLEEMPELKDPEKAEEFRGALRKAQETYGYTKDDLREIVKDIRSVKALADAQKWRDLQAGKQSAKQPREKPKVANRPKGKARNDGKVSRKKALDRAMKTQSTEDFAALLFETPE